MNQIQNTSLSAAGVCNAEDGRFYWDAAEGAIKGPHLLYETEDQNFISFPPVDTRKPGILWQKEESGLCKD